MDPSPGTPGITGAAPVSIPPHRKLILGIALGALVVIIAAIAVWWKLAHPTPTSRPRIRVTLPGRQVVDAAVWQARAGAPNDLPIMPGGRVMQEAFEGRTSGQARVVRLLAVPGTPDQAFTYYTSYFGNTGWNIIPSPDDHKNSVRHFDAVRQTTQAKFIASQIAGQSETHIQIDFSTIPPK